MNLHTYVSQPTFSLRLFLLVVAALECGPALGQPAQPRPQAALHKNNERRQPWGVQVSLAVCANLHGVFSVPTGLLVGNWFIEAL